MTQTELALLLEARAAARTGSGGRLRQRAGLNRSEMARLIGVTPACVHRWEAGERTPSGRHAIAYAKGLRKLAQELALHA